MQNTLTWKLCCNSIWSTEPSGFMHLGNILSKIEFTKHCKIIMNEEKADCERSSLFFISFSAGHYILSHWGAAINYSESRADAISASTRQEIFPRQQSLSLGKKAESCNRRSFSMSAWNKMKTTVSQKNGVLDRTLGTIEACTNINVTCVRSCLLICVRNAIHYFRKLWHILQIQTSLAKPHTKQSMNDPTV